MTHIRNIMFTIFGVLQWLASFQSALGARISSSSSSSDESDWDKILIALESLKFSSGGELMNLIGLGQMPTMQRYGVAFGIITFVLTITTVGALMCLGGTFKRLQEQNMLESSSSSGATTTPATVIPEAIKVRSKRPLLLDSLLESRQRMMTQNYPNRYSDKSDATSGGNKCTKLTKMLLNDKEANDYKDTYQRVFNQCKGKSKNKRGSEISMEAAPDAFARAYAGCGSNTSPAYRQSYARSYENLVCENERSINYFKALWDAQPCNIVGRFMRLEPLTKDHHATKLHHVLSGEAIVDEKLGLSIPPFSPDIVWSFLGYGPFQSFKDMVQSPVFCRRSNEASFAIVHNNSSSPVNDPFVIGALLLTNDDPKNLSIELEAPIVPPSYRDSPEILEACFLVLDRLFAFGYRRIQMALDVKDVDSKHCWAERLGMTEEGILPRHLILKDASRDTRMYAILNSDWSKGGARKQLYKKIYGRKACDNDGWYEVKESEMDEWMYQA